MKQAKDHAIGYLMNISAEAKAQDALKCVVIEKHLPNIDLFCMRRFLSC